MLDVLKPNWDHLPLEPKKPSVPPSSFELKARRAWLNIRPEFTYYDDRDKMQRDQARLDMRQLERDEAWARRAQREQEKVATRQDRARSDKPVPTSHGHPRVVRSNTLPAKSPVQIKPPTHHRPTPVRSPSHPVVVYTLPAPGKPGSSGRVPQPTARAYRPGPPPQPVRSGSLPAPKPKAAPQAVRSYTLPAAVTLAGRKH
ncbi:hypothetical protein FRB99_003603 [Tulasnella sp. 403]|nr:hypothetical protein FRB99_003603 [Tulasnella sp. 403]